MRRKSGIITEKQGSWKGKIDCEIMFSFNLMSLRTQKFNVLQEIGNAGAKV